MHTISNLLVAEWVSGLIALILTAMAFTDLAWGDGASSQEMQRKALAKAKRLGIAAGIFWAITVMCYLFMK